jgi:hypothetical protein
MERWSGGDSRQEAGRWPVLDAAQLDVLRRYSEPRRRRPPQNQLLLRSLRQAQISLATPPQYFRWSVLRPRESPVSTPMPRSMAAISWSRKLPTSSISRTPTRLVEIVGDLRDLAPQASLHPATAQRACSQSSAFQMSARPSLRAGTASGCCRPHSALAVAFGPSVTFRRWEPHRPSGDRRPRRRCCRTQW